MLVSLYSGQDRGNWVKVIEGLGQVWAKFWTDMGQASGIGLGLVWVTSGEGFGQVWEAEGRFRVGWGQARGRL